MSRKKRDVRLFDQLDQEGEYTTWTMVVHIDFPAPTDLVGVLIDNECYCYAEDTVPNGYIIDRAGNVTTIAGQTITWWWQNTVRSDTHKYHIDPQPAGVGLPLIVFRHWTQIFQRNMQLDVPDLFNSPFWDLSPNGRYIAIGGRSTIKAPLNTHVLIYEGA